MADSKYAKLEKRLIAGVIDTLILAPALAGSVYLTFASLPLFFSTDTYKAQTIGMILALSGAYLILPLIVRWLYYAIMWSSPLQATVGMKIGGLIVVDIDHKRISFFHATARYLSATLAFMIGHLIIAFTKKRQGLHDFITNTYVLHKK